MQEEYQNHFSIHLNIIYFLKAKFYCLLFSRILSVKFVCIRYFPIQRSLCQLVLFALHKDKSIGRGKKANGNSRDNQRSQNFVGFLAIHLFFLVTEKNRPHERGRFWLKMTGYFRSSFF